MRTFISEGLSRMLDDFCIVVINELNKWNKIQAWNNFKNNLNLLHSTNIFSTYFETLPKTWWMISAVFVVLVCEVTRDAPRRCLHVP
jgi:hypothetical protein